MDVIILAGGKSLTDPLAELTKGELKSMLPIAGKPMVQWILDAISSSTTIDTVALIGIEDVSKLRCSKTMLSMPDTGSLIGNIQQGSARLDEIHPQETHIVSLSADIPAITAEIIDEMVEVYKKTDCDICYGVVERKVMEKRYPGSKRTYIKIQGEEVCGSDFNYFRKKAALEPNALWQDLIKLRKSPLKQAAIIGLDSLFLLVLGLVDLDHLVERVCRRLKITGKAIRVPYAEVGMDVDKPFQYEIVQADLLR